MIKGKTILDSINVIIMIKSTNKKILDNFLFIRFTLDVNKW